MMTNDPDRNIRFVGRNPNNYVLFNNELWRIIGVFNGQMKIMRKEMYGTVVWNKNKINDWSLSSLKTELNGAYLNSINSTYKNMIDQSHVWNLGEMPNVSTNYTRANMYAAERGTTVYNGRTTTWVGAIGLMHLSDCGYSTSATNSECDATMNDWSKSGTIENCKNNSWIYNSHFQWTLVPNSTYSGIVFLVSSLGNVAGNGDVSNPYGATPVLYLKSGIKITSGDGSKTNPYQLTV